MKKQNEHTINKQNAPYDQNSYKVVEIEEIFMQLTHIHMP